MTTIKKRQVLVDIILHGEEPVTCPKCGGRTNFEELPTDPQEPAERTFHRCLSCPTDFVAEYDSEEEI